MVIMVIDVEPVYVEPLGDSVTVHVPDEGRPANWILPFGLLQLGWVTVPVTGVEGVEGELVIVALEEDADEVQPSEFNTVKV